MLGSKHQLPMPKSFYRATLIVDIRWQPLHCSNITSHMTHRAASFDLKLHWNLWLCCKYCTVLDWLFWRSCSRDAKSRQSLCKRTFAGPAINNGKGQGHLSLSCGGMPPTVKPLHPFPKAAQPFSVRQGWCSADCSLPDGFCHQLHARLLTLLSTHVQNGY